MEAEELKKEGRVAASAREGRLPVLVKRGEWWRARVWGDIHGS